METMQVIDEIKTTFLVCIVVMLSCSFAYFVSSNLPKGRTRLLSLFPVIFIFLLLPAMFSFVPLQIGSGLFIAWLANFKLILFAFDKKPLSTNPPLSLLEFILTTSLPIEIKQSKSKNTTDGLKLLIDLATNIILWLLSIHLHQYKQHMHPYVVRFVYHTRMALGAQVLFMSNAYIARLILAKELEPQFDNSHMATSLQNFWGKRWSIPSSNILRSSVYNPIRSLLTPTLGRRWALHPAIVTTFFVSGLMHELAYYYARHKWPTWEATSMFVINGICIAVEIEVKKALQAKWRLPPAVSIMLTMAFLKGCNSWWMFNDLLNEGADVREEGEWGALVQWVKNGVQQIWLFIVQ